MTKLIQSFPPIANAQATRLILGSMPSAASLAAGQYYAHPQNAFWRIMGELLGFAPDAPYAERVRALLHARIAVWDVLQFCERSGSLDSAIRRDSEVANDFATFFREHPAVTHVFFNGSAAEVCFRRHCADLNGIQAWRFQRLPSTSPAHASLRFDAKLEAWRAALTIDKADNMVPSPQ
jgi:double-stranded uracil-DNA glycosylase